MRRLTPTLLILFVVAGYPAAATGATTASRAADYLVSRQSADGCLGDRTGTGWAAIALRAAGRRIAARAAARCLARQSAALRTATDRELGILAAVAGGFNPRNFGGRDLVGLLERSRHGGYYGRGTATNASIFGVLALKTANRPIPRAVVRQLLRDQAAGGGFDYFPEGQQSDMTAAGIQALRAAGYSCRSRAVRRALTALERFRSGAGYVLGIGQQPNAQSTAWAIQAKLTCGRATMASLRWLRARQTPDGSVRYGPYEVGRIWVTSQAIPALAKRHWPIR
jgi:hypothetical protein